MDTDGGHHPVALAAVLWSSGQTVLAIVLLNMVGVWLAWYPSIPGEPAGSQGMFTQVTIKQLSRLSVNVFLPALVASSLGRRLSITMLAAAWFMPLVAMLHIAIGFVVAFLVRDTVVKPPPHLHRAFLCAITFQNSSALPLVIAKALASQPPFSSDPDAFGKFASYIFVYNVGWQLIFWTIGWSYLTQQDAPTAGRSESTPSDSKDAQSFAVTVIRQACRSPMIIASGIGITIGLITPLRDALFGDGGGFQFVGTALDTLGQAAVPVVTLVIAATLGKAALRSRAAVGDVAMLGDSSGGTTDAAALPSFTLLLTICVMRMVVVGGVQFALMAWFVLPAMDSTADPVQKMVLLIECMVPSANMVIVTCQQSGRQRAAEDITSALALEYVLMLPLLLVWITLAINIIGLP
jgi:predicted permease